MLVRGQDGEIRRRQLQPGIDRRRLQVPARPARLGDDSGVQRLHLPFRPAGLVATGIVDDARRQAGAGGLEGEVAGIVLVEAAGEQLDRGRGVGAPFRHDAHGDGTVERHAVEPPAVRPGRKPAADPPAPVDRGGGAFEVEVRIAAVLDQPGLDRQPRAGQRRAEPELDDAGRRGEVCAQRVPADAGDHAADQRVGKGLLRHIVGAVDPVVAGRGQAEAANLGFAVEADPLQARAFAEGVFRLGDDVGGLGRRDHGRRSQDSG